MSTTVMFAGNLPGDPELVNSCDGKPSVVYRVVVNGGSQNETGEWVDGKPVHRSLMPCGTAANRFDESVDRGGRGRGYGQLRSESCRYGETGGKRTEQVATVSNRFGEWLSLKCGVAGRNRRTVPAATTVN